MEQDEFAVIFLCGFLDGAAVWLDKPWQHLLHECHSAVSALCARAQNGSQEVRFSTFILRILQRYLSIKSSLSITKPSCLKTSLSL